MQILKDDHALHFTMNYSEKDNAFYLKYMHRHTKSTFKTFVSVLSK